MYIEKRISFDPERDKDIVEFLDSMTSHKANKLIRDLVRDYLKHRESSQLDRIEKDIKEIKLKIGNIDSGRLVVHQSAFADEDDDKLNKLVENLNKIGV